MIPILYEKTEQAFTTNGLGRLTDAISCKVEEERNGMYELTMVYPMTGIHFSDLVEDRLILAKPNDTSANQIFRIYSIEKPIDGRVTVLAEHISYLLNVTTVKPFTATSCADAMVKIPQNFATTNYFTFTTDKAVTRTFRLEEPKPCRNILGGESGSLLDVYGKGEYEFDNFTVHLWQNRGSDNGVTLRYGKNIIDLNSTTDDQNSYTGVVPFWKGQEEDSDEEVLVMVDAVVVWSEHQWDFAYPRVIPVDFSDKFDSPPSQSDLTSAAQSYMSSNKGWDKDHSLDIDFVALWQTDEYKDIAPLERVSLCDTVTVLYPTLGVSEKLQVCKTDYNVLLERYNSISLGDTRSSLITEVASIDQRLNQVVYTTKNIFQQAIDHATELITGGLGGHVIIGTNADGQPNEIYVMDTADAETATKILRINVNGIGFATNINGPYTSAWTLDGHFNADFIYSGTMAAERISGGILTGIQNQETYWDLDAGVLHLGQGTAQEIAQYVDASGLAIFMPYHLDGNLVEFSATLLRGESDITKLYPAGSFTWYKKEDYVITYLGAGYTLNFNLGDFAYGGSIILQFHQLEQQVLMDSSTYCLMDDDDNVILCLSNYTAYGYARLNDDESNQLLTFDGDHISVYDIVSDTPRLNVETDFTNGTRTAELEFTTAGLISRFDHFNGTNQTLETTFVQTAEVISAQARSITNLGNDLIEFEGEVADTYATQTDLTATADGITSTVTRYYLTKEDAEDTYTTLAAVQSEIKQEVDSISLSVGSATFSGDSKSASITITLEDEDGDEIDSAQGTITLSGNVVFKSNLSTVGQTTINGSNLYGGTITLGGGSNANGQLNIMDASNNLVGFWNNGGLRVRDASVTLQTTLTAGVWTVYKNTGTSASPTWSGIGTNGKYTLTMKKRNNQTQDFDVYGINALNGAAAMALCVRGTPYYAINTSKNATEGFDISGYGFRHFFQDDIYCTGAFKTSCGYGWAGKFGNDDAPIVFTGANVRIEDSEGYGHLYVASSIRTDGTCSADGYWSDSGDYNGPSDIRLKQSITDISGADAKNLIMRLKPVEFEFKKNPDKTHHGFIAQDIQPFIEKKAALITEDSDGYLGMSYTELIADMVKVIQEQDARINQLEMLASDDRR